MRVAVTGAAGKVGTETVEALSDADHDVVPITHPKHGVEEGYAVDLSEPGGLDDALDGADGVVHLAADRSADAPWDSVLPNNVVATYHLYEAARTAGVDRVVFASSNPDRVAAH